MYASTLHSDVFFSYVSESTRAHPPVSAVHQSSNRERTQHSCILRGWHWVRSRSCELSLAVVKRHWVLHLLIYLKSNKKVKDLSISPPPHAFRSDSGGDGDGTQGEAAAAAAAAANKDVRSAGEHSCQICFDQDHSTVMLPCGHGGLCWDCGLQIYALTEECPMCRTKIELVSWLPVLFGGGWCCCCCC